MSVTQINLESQVRGVHWQYDSTNLAMLLGDTSAHATPATARKAMLCIWKNPSTLKEWEIAGLSVNISSNINLPSGSPSASTDLIGGSVRVTNDAMTEAPLWGMDIIAQQGIAPSSANIQMRAAEFEVQSGATIANFTTDPWSGTGQRANGIEIVLIGTNDGINRGTCALTTWANNSTTSGWWDSGIGISRCVHTGILFNQFATDTSNGQTAFSTAAIYDQSNSATVLKVTGTHSNIVDVSGATCPIGWNGALAVVGPAGNGSGNEALTANCNGVTLGVRREGAAGGTLEVGTIGGHNLRLIANSAQCAYFDASTKATVLGAPASALADGTLSASTVSFYLDEVGNNLKFKVKYANGTTVKTGTLAVA